MKRLTMIGLLIVLAGAALVGCGGAKILSDEDAATFAAEVDALSENLLVSLNAGDYESYVRDMDQAMKDVSKPADFESLRALLSEKVGGYQSRTMTQVVEQENLRTVFYDAKFEKEDGVTVRIVFDTTETPPRISGLWFDSPALRKK